MRKAIAITALLVGSITPVSANETNCEYGTAMEINTATKAVTYSCSPPPPVVIKPIYKEEANTHTYNPNNIEHYYPNNANVEPVVTDTATVLSDTATVITDTTTATITNVTMDSLYTQIMALFNQLVALIAKLKG